MDDEYYIEIQRKLKDALEELVKETEARMKAEDRLFYAHSMIMAVSVAAYLGISIGLVLFIYFNSK